MISLALRWVIGVLTFVVVGSGAFYAVWWYQNNNAPASEETTPPASNGIEPTPEETVTPEDPYAGWNTYTNSDIGYQLRYPTGWTVDEVDLVSEVSGQPVKYVTVTTADGKYFLHFGLKRPSDTFDLTDRTGVGAGEFQDVTGVTVEIVDVAVNIQRLVYLGKTKEYFYNQPKGSETSCDCSFSATFSYKADAVDYDTLDMTGLADRETAELILGSVAWLPS